MVFDNAIAVNVVLALDDIKVWLDTIVAPVERFRYKVVIIITMTIVDMYLDNKVPADKVDGMSIVGHYVFPINLPVVNEEV